MDQRSAARKRHNSGTRVASDKPKQVGFSIVWPHLIKLDPRNDTDYPLNIFGAIRFGGMEVLVTALKETQDCISADIHEEWMEATPGTADARSVECCPEEDSREPDFQRFLPREIGRLNDPQKDLPRIAKDSRLTGLIEAALRKIPTTHALHRGDARELGFIPDESVQLIVTSPPYWTLKKYRDTDGQLGDIEEYDAFHRELDKVWANAYRVLVPGGRLICVVGDVCLSRRKNNGRHTVVPLHAAIQEHCRKIGFDNVAPIIWHKIANAVHEVENGSGGFLGKPYEPNAVIKNDIEFILMQRKPGGYRSPSLPVRILSVISEENHRQWFQQIWTGLNGVSTKQHPAPFPVELAERLIRMFSFAGDTVLDPFMGTASTNLAASRSGRNSIGVEIDPHYFGIAANRLRKEAGDLFGAISVQTLDCKGQLR